MDQCAFNLVTQGFKSTDPVVGSALSFTSNLSIVTRKHNLCKIFIAKLSVAILVKRFNYVCTLTNRCASEVVFVEEGLNVVRADSFFACTVDATEGGVGLEGGVKAK